MLYRSSSTIKDYYEVLGITQDAASEKIRDVVMSYRETLQGRLNNPLQMKAARQELDHTLPLIEQYLLAGEEQREAYNRQLALAREQANRQGELADREGLDELLPQPFFFDPFNDYDTEVPAMTIREVGMKLDREWPTTFKWIKRTSRDVHVLVGYLTFAAGRQGLAQQVEHIIDEVSQNQLNINEGIERCIELLDPDVERPRISLQGPVFDGASYYFNAGDCLPDRVERIKITLLHSGLRGCAFGSIEALSSWVTVDDDKQEQRFAVMPQHTEASIGASELSYTIALQLSQIEPNADYVAQLVVRLENGQQPLEIPFAISLHLLPRPPMVIFEPHILDYDHPLWVGVRSKGETIEASVRVKNMGDEEHVPLSARIKSKNPAASVKPVIFHHDDTLAITIKTDNFSTGNSFDIAFPIDYSGIAGAKGPQALPVRGALYPTVWQSFFAQKSPGKRILGALMLGTGVGVVLALVNAISNLAWWIPFIVTPLLCLLLARPCFNTIAQHFVYAGQSDNAIKRLPLWQRLLPPLTYGLLVALICRLISDTVTASVISFIGGAITGLIYGFTACNITDFKYNKGVYASTQDKIKGK